MYMYPSKSRFLFTCTINNRTNFLPCNIIALALTVLQSRKHWTLILHSHNISVSNTQLETVLNLIREELKKDYNEQFDRHQSVMSRRLNELIFLISFLNIRARLKCDYVPVIHFSATYT